MKSHDIRHAVALGAAALALTMFLSPAQADHHAKGKAHAHAHGHEHDHGQGKAGSETAGKAGSMGAHADHAGSGSAHGHDEEIHEVRPAPGGGTAYGKDLALPEATSIASLQADPAAWHGKHVRVEGTITDVCPKAGCWMKIADEAGAEVTLKVRDGVMVFPVTAKGSRAIAEGVVRKIELNEKQARAYLAHLAEEKGEDFDPSSVQGPRTIVRVDGRGAIIQPQ